MDSDDQRRETRVAEVVKQVVGDFVLTLHIPTHHAARLVAEEVPTILSSGLDDDGIVDSAVRALKVDLGISTADAVRLIIAEASKLVTKQTGQR